MPKWYLVLPSFFFVCPYGPKRVSPFYRVLPSFARLILALGMCILRLIRSTFFFGQNSIGTIALLGFFLPSFVTTNEKNDPFFSLLFFS